jgi:YHS domain-containing protein
MKIILPLTCALLTLGFISFSNASDTAAPKPPQAQIVKTPEEKAKAAELAKTYPLTTCPVSGDKLGAMGETIDTLYQGQLIRFCCKGCIKSFNKNPDKYLKEIDAAKKPAA